jgi:hypothetical protein
MRFPRARLRRGAAFLGDAARDAPSRSSALVRARDAQTNPRELLGD